MKSRLQSVTNAMNLFAIRAVIFQIVLLFALCSSSYAFVLPFLFRATGEWEGCSGQAGVCIDVNAYTCSGSTLTGKCPGAANIRCCPFPDGVSSSQCTASSGVCTRTENCAQTSLTGLCPGPTEITCCTGSPESDSSCTLGSASGCSTEVASGITKQLVDELNAMGISFATLSDTTKFRCSSPCQPYLQTAAKDSLSEAASAANDFITLNSAYRSSAQQYLLYKWYLAGACDSIDVAARPGTSNHESGLAIDTSNYNYWRSRLEPYGWDWLGPSDAVHFDYTSGENQNVRRQSLRAFQRLWNRNNPTDQIADDGIYGSETEARLKDAPCDGW